MQRAFTAMETIWKLPKRRLSLVISSCPLLLPTFAAFQPGAHLHKTLFQPTHLLLLELALLWLSLITSFFSGCRSTNSTSCTVINRNQVESQVSETSGTLATPHLGLQSLAISPSKEQLIKGLLQ